MKQFSRIIRYLAVVLILAAPWPAFGQIRELAFEDTESAAAYRRAIRFSGVKNRAFYIDEVTGDIPMDAAPRIQPRVEAPPSPVPDRTIPYIIVVGVFGLIGFLLWRFGGQSQITLRNSQAVSAGRVPAVGPAQAGADQNIGDFLKSLAAMPDRRAALILLVGRVLRRAAETNGLRLKRSETARDILRRLPRDWALFDPTRNLVVAEELVHFGGRGVSDGQLDAYIAIARPILNGRADG